MSAAPDTSGDRTWYGATTVLTMSLVGWLLAGPVNSPTIYAIGVDVLAALLVLAAARSARAGRAVRRAALILAVALVATAIGRRGYPELAQNATTMLVLLVGTVVPAVIGRDIVRRRIVDAHLVFGAITIYLLLGIASAMCVAIAAKVTDAPMLDFGATVGDGAFRDQVYFSFVTLSTTGYGDVVPASGIARAIAILTALAGQLYLVTAVATAVSLFSATRFRRRGVQDPSLDG
jgi:hypothetical protein